MNEHPTSSQAGPVEQQLPACFAAVLDDLGLDFAGRARNPGGVDATVLANLLLDRTADAWRNVSRDEAVKLLGIALRFQHVSEATRLRVEAARAAFADLPASEQAEILSSGRGGPRDPNAQGRRWFTDDWDGLVAEVGALLGIGARAASSTADLAIKLRERHPRIWQLLHAGALQLKHVRAAVAAGEAVLDPRLVDRYDTLLARRLAHALSRENAVVSEKDVELLASEILAKLDPDAIPLPPATAPRSCEFRRRVDGSVALTADFDPIDGLFAAEEVERVAKTVCRGDGRSLARRRSDALLALIRGYDSLGCLCGGSSGEGADQCEWVEQKPRYAQGKTGVHVRIVINESTLAERDDEPAYVEETGTLPPEVIPAEQARDLIENGEAWFETFGKVIHDDPEEPGEAGPEDPGLFDAPAAPQPEAETEPEAKPERGPAPEPGQVPPAFTVARRGRNRVVATEPNGYRHSALQAEYVFLRHGTCTFPGCTVKSRNCQIDHVQEAIHSDPERGGKTSITNEMPLCPRHHRIKTEQDWLPILNPDGTVEWHSPTGRTYTTGLVQGTDLFPDLDLIEWRPSSKPLKPRDPNAPPQMTRTEIHNLARQERREQYIRARHADPPGNPAA